MHCASDRYFNYSAFQTRGRLLFRTRIRYILYIFFMVWKSFRDSRCQSLRPSGTSYFLSVSHSSYICGRSRPILTSLLALSPSLHSRRRHRKLRTSFPWGGGLTEKFNQLDRWKTFLSQGLIGEQTISSPALLLASWTRVYVHACSERMVWYARPEVEAWHPTHGHVCSTPTRTPREYLMNPILMKTRCTMKIRSLRGLCNSKPRVHLPATAKCNQAIESFGQVLRSA